jgi:hypothetical protein
MVKFKPTSCRLNVLVLMIVGSLILTARPASAFLGETFGGAMKGAALGSLLGGRDGARTGAGIGAGVGLLTGESRESGQRKAEAAAQTRYEQQRLALEQERQADEAARWKAESKRFADGVPSNLVSIGGLQPREDPELIAGIQSALTNLGYDPGNADGNLSDKTIAAIMRYQSRAGLLETGQPSVELLKHMLRNGG